MAQKYEFILIILCAFSIPLTEKNGQYVNLHNMLDFQETVKTISRMLCLPHTVR